MTRGTLVFRAVSSAASHVSRVGVSIALLVLVAASCGAEERSAATGTAAAPEPPSATLTGVDLRPPLPLDCAATRCALDLSSQLEPGDPTRQRITVRGSTSGAQNRSAPATCPGLGPEVAYALDLRAFAEPLRFALGLRADFDGTLRVERGAAEDPALVACNTDHVSGVDDAFAAVTLEPNLYRIIVDGEAPQDEGEFELWLELLPREERCRAAPANDHCAGAIRLDPEKQRQALFGTTECATDQAQPLWECGNFSDRRAEVFYGLDLTARSEPVLLHASTNLEPAGANVILYVLRESGGECAETLRCNDELSVAGAPAELWASLPPGRYLLAVESRGVRPSDFGLLVELEEACVVSNDSCQTAQDIAPLLGTQSFTAWPMCGDDSLSSTCQRSGPSPDVFYRLDLRSFAQPVRVQATTSRAGRPLSSLLLLGEREGTCAGELWCGDFDLWLPPAVYYLALDTFRDQQGPVQLAVTLSEQGAPAASVCIDERVAECARAADCCDGDRDQCWLALRSCGLVPEALDCLCTAEPACCGGAGTSYDCGLLLAECGTFCDGFDPALTCP